MNDDGCPGNQVCANAQCVEPPLCAVNGDCFAGRICVAGSCTNACAANVDCPMGFVCLMNGQCALPQCQITADCAAGEVCVGQRCVPDQPCANDAACRQGEVCDAGDCRAGCRDDDDCDGNQTCLVAELRCIEAPTCNGDVDCLDDRVCRPCQSIVCEDGTNVCTAP
jgi:hypothetical protein